jgi:hypothetical protein
METNQLQDFTKYVDVQILPATTDVGNLDDPNRKHVQKLIYTNLCDRFDAMIDGTILDNCRVESLVTQATAGMTQQITEADLLKLLMHSGDIQDAINEKLRASLRNSVLRERHSKKLAKLFVAFGVTVDFQKKPKVNVNNGKILEKIKPQHETIPYSICGYADWLYSRRNSIVHGAGTASFLQNDKKQLKKIYNCTPAKKIRLKLSSTTTAADFYKSVVELLMQASEES